MLTLSFPPARLVPALALSIGLLAAATPAHADSPMLDIAARQPVATMDTNLASLHTQSWARRDLNQFNPGVGLTIPSSVPQLSLVSGFYRNSYDRTSVYGGVLYEPFNWNGAGLHWRAGVIVGLISGYSNDEEPDRPLMTALALSAQTESGWGARLIFCPAGLSQPFGNDTRSGKSGAIGLQLLAPLPLL
jgi:hypothetical protein